MRQYTAMSSLKADAKTVSEGDTVMQRQDSLTDQLNDLHTLANRFGLYDAADFLSKLNAPWRHN